MRLADRSAVVRGARRARVRHEGLRLAPGEPPGTRAVACIVAAGSVFVASFSLDHQGRVVTHDNESPRRARTSGDVLHRGGTGDGGARGRRSRRNVLDPLPGPEPESVALEVSSEKGFGKEDYHVFGPYRGTVEVGDVELSTMNIVWFHVVSPDGAPVGGALAHPTPGGTFVARADADGNGQIESNVPMKSIRFVAPGSS